MWVNPNARHLLQFVGGLKAMLNEYLRGVAHHGALVLLAIGIDEVLSAIMV